MLPWVHNPNSISIRSAIFAQLGTVSSGMSIPLNIAPWHGAVWTPSNTWFLGPPKYSTQVASHLVQPFLHSLRQSVPIPYNGATFYPQNLRLSVGVSRPHLIHDSFGVAEPTTQTASRLDQPFLHGSLQSIPILYNGLPLCPPSLK